MAVLRALLIFLRLPRFSGLAPRWSPLRRYKGVRVTCARLESNQQPEDYESTALTFELRALEKYRLA